MRPVECPGLSCRLALTEWANRKLENSHDAEDLAGEICLHCMRGRGRFRGEAEFSTWLRSVALNALRDFIKARRKRHEFAAIGLDEAESAAFRRLSPVDEDDGPQILSVREAMAHLTPRQRHLIEWKYGDGLSYAEIATRLNTTDTAVSQALRRARMALKRAIEAESDPPS